MTAENSECILYALMQVEEQLAYAHARCSVLHRVKAQQIREVLYEQDN
jgi:hypothetical protein